MPKAQHHSSPEGSALQRGTILKNIFITKIHIDKVRHLENVDIELSRTERKHLILTGKNGSGKTSLLEAIRDSIALLQREMEIRPQDVVRIVDMDELLGSGSKENNAPAVDILFSEKISSLSDVMFAYHGVERSKFEVPSSIEAVTVGGKALVSRNASKDFLKYILYLYVQYLSAKDLNSLSSETLFLETWFDMFKQALRDIYGCPDLELKLDIKKLEFQVSIPNREPFGLNEMSDGYKAFVEIFMELIMRFGNENGTIDYNQSAIVIIDEIETHLHVDLQKKAMPFLTQMFPYVQFVVATHSPFVITSLSNAVVFDLEKLEQLDNPSFYSYEAIVESFLDTDMYSAEMKQRLERYKELCFKKRTPEETEEFLRTKTELELLSPASKELYFAFHALEQKRKEVIIDQVD